MKSKKAKAKTKKAKSSKKKSKLERIMFEENIPRHKLKKGTGLSQPVLSRLINGSTVFRNRTIRDMELYLKRPAEQFLGFEGEKVKITREKDKD